MVDRLIKEAPESAEVGGGAESEGGSGFSSR
jgi:hypothetical protein